MNINSYLKTIKEVELFNEIEEEQLHPLLSCLSAKLRHYEKGEYIYQNGDSVSKLGIVLSGQVQLTAEDYYGNKSILMQVGPANLFAEAFACAGTESFPFNIVATLDCDIMFIECQRLSSPCSNSCDFHKRLIKNLLGIVSKKNIALTQKMEFTSKRTTREKLMAYLSAEAQQAGSSKFDIEFNRQELADYLAVDRSAMSAELSKMRDDGILRYNKNHFELL